MTRKGKKCAACEKVNVVGAVLCGRCGGELNAAEVKEYGAHEFKEGGSTGTDTEQGRSGDSQKLITSTAFDIPGYEIVDCLGLVRGVAVRIPHFLQQWLAGLRVLVGGRSQELIQLSESTRKDAAEFMRADAERVGANAVIGVRYDGAPVIGLASEVICYGTAVIVRRRE